MAEDKTRYTKMEIRKYPDGYWITYWVSSRCTRVKISGPYSHKYFAVTDIEILNNKYKNGRR